MDMSLYETLGRQQIQGLVKRFYEQVPNDPILGPMYPADDLVGAEERLFDFLMFRLGGPQDYLKKRGHPRLRMRHNPFKIDRAARDQWLKLMESSLEEAEWSEEQKAQLLAFFEMVADHMINRPG